MLKIALRAPVMNCCGSPTIHLKPIVPHCACDKFCVRDAFVRFGDALLHHLRDTLGRWAL
jgi:hypothetical protein